MAKHASHSARSVWLPALISTAVGLFVFAAAIFWPRISGTDVFVPWAPLKAQWLPRFFPPSVFPIIVGIAGILWWHRATAKLPWWAYLLAVYAVSWAWTMSLAWIDGSDKISQVFERYSEYLHPAKQVGSISDMMHSFVDRIPLGAAENWPIHVAGHPPGAFLAFVGFDRLGISDPFWVGLIVASLGCTAVLAAVLTVKTLGSEAAARRCAPWLVFAPFVLWVAVSGDALFMAIAAWGLALLAFATTAKSLPRFMAHAIGAGLLLGLSVYVSYGLVLLGILALVILYLGRCWKALPWALGAALAVAAAFTVSGFRWWEAYPVLVERYYDGIQASRQYGYWIWANFGAWTFTTGLAFWTALPAGVKGLRRQEQRSNHVVSLLGCAGFFSVLVASVSGMSKAEVERIWLPFTLWAMLLPGLLPTHWQRPLLALQIASTLTIQHLLYTQW